MRSEREKITGKEAAEIGLVTRSFPLDELEEAVEKLADKLIKISPPCMEIQKRGINRSYEIMGMRTAIDNWVDQMLWPRVLVTDEVKEFNRIGIVMLVSQIILAVPADHASHIGIIPAGIQRIAVLQNQERILSFGCCIHQRHLLSVCPDGLSIPLPYSSRGFAAYPLLFEGRRCEGRYKRNRFG